MNFGLGTECKYGSMVCGIYFIGQELQTWRRRDSEFKPTCLFYVVNKNIKEVLIKMKTIFLWLFMSVDNETFSLKFRFQLLVRLLETEMARSFCKTFSIHIGHDCSNIRQQLCSFLGSAVNIRPKPPAPQDNFLTS